MADTASEKSGTTLHELTPEEVQKHLQNHQCLLIDVREPGEYEAERIPGALLYPLSEFDPAALPLEGGRRIILHCGTGKRSQRAAGLIHDAGVAETTHLKGGINAWKAAHLPFISFDPATGKSSEQSI